MDISHRLNRTLEVWRESFTDDGMGGQAATLIRQTDVAAKVDQPSATDRMLAQQAGAEHTHDIYLLPTADVQRGDELRGDGQVFRVGYVVEPSAPIYRKAESKLIERQGA
ncbi:phage head closure protein [Streptomyces sp. NPDC059499]|uniref:phage head closure protein n=1 Tax=Streptomyces sp. NPDC059499 TaxID=3346852 RepID=UPI0036C6AB97